jgi:hypothetical protein
MVPLGTTEANGDDKAFNAVAVSAAQKVSAKESRACATEAKKDRDHTEWANDFWRDQLHFAVSSFMPIYTTMDQLGLCDGAESIKQFTATMESAYSERLLEPLTTQDLMEFFSASKR